MYGQCVHVSARMLGFMKSTFFVEDSVDVGLLWLYSQRVVAYTFVVETMQVWYWWITSWVYACWLTIAFYKLARCGYWLLTFYVAVNDRKRLSGLCTGQV